MEIRSKLPEVGSTIFSVMSQLALQHGAINLGQGFPDFDPPDTLRTGLEQAMRDGHNQYAPSAGILPLRRAIAAKCKRLYGHEPNADHEVTVTSGASEAIFVAIAATVDRDDEVIVLDPCYDCYAPVIKLQGARAVHVPLNLPEFSVDWQRVRDAVTAATRMIIVNSPHNPSGAVFSADDLDVLAEIVRDSRILVLSDEVYQHICYADGGHQSVLRHAELAQRSFVVGSFGKTWHCTGWKVGYCVAPAVLSGEFRKIHQYNTFSTFAPAQFALAAVLEDSTAHVDGLADFYRAKRDRFRALLAASRFVMPEVAGGYFQLVDYSAIDERDDINFSEWLVREAGVAGIPLTPFYEEPPADARLLRFCFAKSDDTMEAAAERLCKL